MCGSFGRSGRSAALGQGVDGHGGEQDQCGHDVGRGRAQAEQAEAVVDRGHHEATEEGVDHLAVPAEQVRSADDRRGHGEQHQLAAVGVRRDRAQPRGQDDARDGGGQPGQREGERPDQVQADAGSPGRLGVAADRVDVTAEAGPPEHDRIDDEHPEHDEHHPGDPAQRHQADAPVGVADQDDHDAGHRHDHDLQQGDADRRGDKAGGPALAVAQQQDSGGGGHDDHHHDPPGDRAEVAGGQPVDDRVGDRDGTAGAVAAARHQQDQQALQAEQTGQGHDERRQRQPGDQEAEDGADDGPGGQPEQDGHPPGHREYRPGGDHGADRAAVPDGQVDLAQQQDPDLRHAQDDVGRALDQQVDQVPRGQEEGVADLEVDHDGDQAQGDRQGAALAAPDAPGQDPQVLAQRAGDHLGSGRLRHVGGYVVAGLGPGGW